MLYWCVCTYTHIHTETSLQEPDTLVHCGFCTSLLLSMTEVAPGVWAFFSASSLITSLLRTKPLQLQEEVPQARFTSSVNRFQTTKQKLHPLLTSFDFGFAAQLDHQSPLLAGRSLIRNQCPYQN